MSPARRTTDAAAHAHRRDDDPSDSARLHLRTDDPPLPRVEWRTPTPQKEQAMTPGLEDAPRTECADSCAFGAFIGALAGCFLAGLVVVGIQLLRGG